MALMGISVFFSASKAEEVSSYFSDGNDSSVGGGSESRRQLEPGTVVIGFEKGEDFSPEELAVTGRFMDSHVANCHVGVVGDPAMDGKEIDAPFLIGAEELRNLLRQREEEAWADYQHRLDQEETR